MDNKEKQEAQERAKKIREIRKMVISEMEDNLNERYLYTIPYKEFYLTNSSDPNEVGFSMQDIYVSVKQLEDSEGKIKRLFELFDEDLNKIAETDADGRIRYDREITEEMVRLQDLLRKQNEEQGTDLKIAGLNREGQLEAYMQMMNHEIVSLTAEQKAKADRDKEKGIKKGDKENIGLENKVDEQAVKEDKELQTLEIANDLGIDPKEIYQVTEVRDDAFLRSEGITNGYELSAVQTRDGALHMVSRNAKGDYEKSKDFTEGSTETGRTTYSTNDYNNMRETNTYGAIYFANDPNKRISGRIGQYGELEIIRQERITSNPDGPNMNTDETWSPGVLIQTDNTAISDMDLNGEYSQNKVVFNKIDRDNIRMNQESSTIREHGGENLKVQDIANDATRGESAFLKVKAELKERGVELSSEESKALEDKFVEKGVTYCDEEVQDFCDRYEVYKENKEKEKEKQNDSEPETEGKYERTLESDALERREEALRKRFGGQN